MCNILELSRSGYYAWKKRSKSNRAKANEYLLKEICRIYEENKKVYGSPRIYKALAKEGMVCSKNRIARIMRKNSIVALPHRIMRNKAVFKSSAPISGDNLVQRNFTVKTPNKIWVSDITYISIKKGWLHLAIVMDLYSRRIIGWSMKDRPTDDLVIDALEMAILNRNPGYNLIHHSDKGGQYQSHNFKKLLLQNNIIASISRNGDCYDNAVVESFFKTLKSESFINQTVKTKEQTRAIIFEYIEIFYNKKRLHSTLGYQSPEQFENANII